MFVLKIGKKKGEYFEVLVNSKSIGFFDSYTLAVLKIKDNTVYTHATNFNIIKLFNS